MSSVVVLSVAELRAVVREAVRAELAQARQPEEWLDVRAAAAHLGLHHEYVSRLARRGELPASRVGREWRFRRSELDAHLTQQRAG